MCMKDQYKLPVTQRNTAQGYSRLEHRMNDDFKKKKNLKWGWGVFRVFIFK